MNKEEFSSVNTDNSTLSDFQKAQLAMERAKVRVERQKGWLTAASIIVSALSILAVYWGAQITQTREAKLAFQLKLAEVVASSESASQAQSLIKALAVLFPDQVPENMQKELGKLNYGRGGKYKFLDLIATQSTPQGRCAIMKTYAELFNGDPYRTPLAIQDECKKNKNK